MENNAAREAIRRVMKKQAAVDKVPVFSKFEVNLTTRDVEKMFLKHYPMARKGSLKFDRKVKGPLVVLTSESLWTTMTQMQKSGSRSLPGQS